jgi:AcrR family transcriptional regulator
MINAEGRTTRPMLDPRVIASFRRRRITDAFAELCAEEGYRAITVADIVARAKSSRNTFYEEFANRDEAFLAILDAAISELFGRAEAACGAAGERPEERIEAGLRAVLDWVAEQPAAASVCLVDSLSATPESLRLYLEALTRFATLLRGNVPTEVPRPRTTEESLVGGVAAILRQRIQSGEAKRVPELLPALTIFVRAPFIATDQL